MTSDGPELGICPGNKKMAKNDVNYIILMKNFTTKK